MRLATPELRQPARGIALDECLERLMDESGVFSQTRERPCFE
jgi:hypothetical protein